MSANSATSKAPARQARLYSGSGALEDSIVVLASESARLRFGSSQHRHQMKLNARHHVGDTRPLLCIGHDNMENFSATQVQAVLTSVIV